MSPKVGVQTYKLIAVPAAAVKTNLEDWRACDKYVACGSMTLRGTGLQRWTE